MQLNVGQTANTLEWVTLSTDVKKAEMLAVFLRGVKQGESHFYLECSGFFRVAVEEIIKKCCHAYLNVDSLGCQIRHRPYSDTHGSVTCCH